MANGNHVLANNAQPKLRPWQRLLAWGGIGGGTLLSGLAATLMILGAPRYVLLPLATIVFGAVLVVDGVLRLRLKSEFRQSRAWRRIWLLANILFMGASLSKVWLTSDDPRLGAAGLAMIAAFILTMAMCVFVILLSGAPWRSEVGSRR